MGCFELPHQPCHDLNQLMARFWWGANGDNRKIHWIAWNNLCCPKADGSLGFQNLHHFTRALLEKQGWRLLHQPNSLLAQLLKARYYPASTVLDAKSKAGASYTWRSIVTRLGVLKMGARYQVGDRSNIRIWKDPWMPLPHSFRPFFPAMETTEDC